jgi:hypothetical protein
MKTSTVKILIKVIVLLLILSSLIARFLYLEADFPWGFTWEGALYTDEGWYSYNAMMHTITGDWYVDGDYNAIVFRPTFHMFLILVFKALGLSLFSARFTVILFSMLIISLSYLLVRKYIDASAALVTALLLSINFTFFVYSRLALSEIPTVSIGFLSIFIVSYFSDKKSPFVEVIASMTFFFALLTKSSVIPLFLAFLYAIYVRHAHLKKRIYAFLWVFATLSILLFLRRTLGRTFFPEDYVYFSSNVFTYAYYVSDSYIPRFNPDPLFVLYNLPRTLWSGMPIDKLMYPLTITMMFFPIFLLISKKYRENPLVTLCFIWIFSYLATFSLSKYQPLRYYLTLITPVTILFSIIAVSLYHSLKPSRWSYLPIVVLSLIVFTNASSITSYLWHPNYSFLTMTQDVQRRINQESHRKPLLLGNLANSISLATGIPSINEDIGTRDLRWKLSRYQPTHYVSLGVNNEVIDIVEESYTLEKLATYDVFGNYYRGKRVHLYKLTQKRNKY